MIETLGIIIGLYGVILALVAPWPVAAWGMVGLIVGGLAGSSAGLAFGGGAINAAIPMGLVGFVITATIAQIWQLTTAVQDLKTGREYRTSKPPSLWETLVLLWGSASGAPLPPQDPPEQPSRRAQAAPSAPERPISRTEEPHPLIYSDVRRWMQNWEVPPLNPFAPEYDPDLVRQIEHLRDQYMAAGYSERQAVVEAIHDLTSP